MNFSSCRNPTWPVFDDARRAPSHAPKCRWIALPHVRRVRTACVIFSAGISIIRFITHFATVILRMRSSDVMAGLSCRSRTKSCWMYCIKRSDHAMSLAEVHIEPIVRTCEVDSVTWTLPTREPTTRSRNASNSVVSGNVISEADVYKDDDNSESTLSGMTMSV